MLTSSESGTAVLYNGLVKKHAIYVPRVKEGLNKGKTIIQAIDFILKEEQK